MKIIKQFFIIISISLIALFSNNHILAQNSSTLNIEESYELSKYADSTVISLLYDSIWHYLERDLIITKALIPIYKKYIDKSGIDFYFVDLCNIKSAYYNYKNMNDSAIFFLEKSINRIQNSKNDIKTKKESIYRLPFLYNNLAIIYDDLGMYESAIEFQLKSIYGLRSIFKTDTNNVDLNILYSNVHTELGMFYSNFNDTINSHKYFLKGINLAHKFNINEALAYAELNYAVFLTDIDELEIALTYFQKGKIYYAKEGQYYSQLIIALNEANIYDKKGKTDIAIAIADSCNKVAKKLGYEALNLSSLKMIFYFYYNNTSIYDYNKKAINAANKYLQNARLNNDLLGIAEVSFDLAKILNKNGEHNKAALLLIESKTISDSINNMDQQSNVSILESKHKLIQTNMENKLLIKENKLKDKYISYQLITRNIIIVLLIITLLFGYNIIRNNGKIKKINLQLEETNEILEQKSIKLEQYNSALEKIFGTFSHDLRGPIGTADSFFRILEEDGDITEEEKDEYIKMIGKSMKSTFLMLENLLYWSKNRLENKPNISEFSIHSLIINIIENIELTIFTKQIKIINNIDNSIIIKSDEDYLRIILRNLISNAIKFTPENGEINIGYYLKDNMRYISIKDNGVGMYEEQCANLFNNNNPISNLGTNNEKGTGLGLLISSELIQSIGGEIKVESKINQGSTFYITLPMHANIDKAN